MYIFMLTEKLLNKLIIREKSHFISFVMLFVQIAIVEALCRNADADGERIPISPDASRAELNTNIKL